MISKAVARYIRISPRKTRQVLDLVRGKNVNNALAILMGLKQRAAGIVTKVVKSAVANAKNQGAEDNLYISRITADGGPVWKRHRAAPMGRAMMIRKRTAHITVELDARQVKTKPVDKNIPVKAAAKANTAPAKAKAAAAKAK